MPIADPAEDLATPTLAQVLSAALEGRLEDVHTASWGSVLAYYPATQRVDVQLVLRRYFTDEDGVTQSERPAPLQSVPVIFPGSGQYSITWPIQPGDTVLVVHGEGPIDQWMQGGRTDVDPGDTRRHSLTDAVAIPGLRPSTKAIGPTGTDPASMVVSGPSLKLGDNTATSPVGLNADLASFISIFTNWTPVANDGGAALKAAITAYISAHAGFPVGSTTVKAK